MGCCKREKTNLDRFHLALLEEAVPVGLLGLDRGLQLVEGLVGRLKLLGDVADVPADVVDLLFELVALRLQERLGLLECVDLPHVRVDLRHLRLLHLLRRLQSILVILRKRNFIFYSRAARAASNRARVTS